MRSFVQDGRKSARICAVLSEIATKLGASAALLILMWSLFALPWMIGLEQAPHEVLAR